MLVQVFVAIILLLIFSLDFKTNNTFSKFILIGAIFILIKANGYVKEMLGGIGSDVNIGAGTITANYNPLTKVKSATVIGNNVKIGSNSVLVAPIKIDEGANVAALSVVTKNIPAWALAITRSPLKILENWVKKIQNR